MKGEDVETEVINGGLLGEHKGINLPGTPVSLPSITDKDKADMAFGLKHGIDMIADVVRAHRRRRPLQTQSVHRILGGHVPVIAKLEKPQAIDNLEAIFEVADGVMVARGDLGVEVPPEQVPIIQKHIIRRAAECAQAGDHGHADAGVDDREPAAHARRRPATWPTPVFDGTDAVMLSGETASGKYPVEAVKMMARSSWKLSRTWTKCCRGAGAANAGAVDLGDDLRIGGACRRRPRHEGDCGFHANRYHGTPGFEIPAEMSNVSLSRTSLTSPIS